MRNSIVVASRGRNPDNPSDRKTKSNGTFVQMLETLGGGKTNTLSTVEKDNYVMEYEECDQGTNVRSMETGRRVHVEISTNPAFVASLMRKTRTPKLEEE